jgi:4-hydroxy-tetrahydrodipicolinate synthase
MNVDDKARFFGIYAATVCPMQGEDAAIDEAALSEHLEPLAGVDGLAGFLINGHAGENFLLTAEEKRRVVEVARSAVGDRLIVAGVNQEDSHAAAREAEAAMAAGADAIMLFPPMSWALGHDQDMALRHHRIVDAAVQAPMFLYQAPVGAGSMAYGAELLKELVLLPNVVGVKEGSWETAAYEANRRLIKETVPNVGVMASGDEHLLTCFILGSEGSLVSLACLWPEPVIQLERAVRDGDLEAAQATHAAIYPLARAIYGTTPGYHATARLKACLKLLGRLSDDQVRPPIQRLQHGEIERLHGILRHSGLL